MTGFRDVPGPVASQRGHAFTQAQEQHCNPAKNVYCNIALGVYCNIALAISARMLRGEMLTNQNDAIASYQLAFAEMKAHLGTDTPAVLAAHNAIQGRP